MKVVTLKHNPAVTDWAGEGSEEKNSPKKSLFIVFTLALVLCFWLFVYKRAFSPPERSQVERGGRYYIWRLICGETSKKKQGINSETHRLPDKGQRVGEHRSPNPHINNCVLASICSDFLTHAHMMSKICTFSTLTGTWPRSAHAQECIFPCKHTQEIQY